MKKKYGFIVSIFLLGLLSGCGKSEAAQSVDNKISSIGSVSIDSDASITDAESAYGALSTKDKKKVENYETLVQARKDYDQIVKDCEDKINEAYAKIDLLDMKSAYEIAASLPNQYSKDKDNIISKIDSLCYDDTFLVKLQNVVSTLPTKIDNPGTNVDGDISIGADFSDQSSLNTAYSEYYSYLNKYYTSKGSDSNADYGAIDWSNQSFTFEDKNGHEITIISLNASYIGSIYFMNIILEKGVNYRDVLD